MVRENLSTSDREVGDPRPDRILPKLFILHYLQYETVNPD